jgi:hypothetical protein
MQVCPTVAYTRWLALQRGLREITLRRLIGPGKAQQRQASPSSAGQHAAYPSTLKAISFFSVDEDLTGK